MHVAVVDEGDDSGGGDGGGGRDGDDGGGGGILGFLYPGLFLWTCKSFYFYFLWSHYSPIWASP